MTNPYTTFDNSSSGREVAQLQEWFEIHWNRASDVTEAVIETISRHTHLYSPFDVYAQSGQNRCPRRNLSTTLRHRRFLFTDSFLLLWKWRVG